MCNSQQLLSLPQIFIIAHFILDVSRSVILFMMMQWLTHALSHERQAFQVSVMWAVTCDIAIHRATSMTENTLIII